MSDQSARLSLPYLAPAQAQKHVTVNEALRRLDAIVQLSVVSAATHAQPASPADGQIWLLPSGKTGEAWGAMADGALAYWRDGAWEQLVPKEGWLAYVADTDQLLAFNGAAWSGPSMQNVTLLGVGATADPTNRLAVSSPALLFNHAGAGVQAKLNKAAAGDTASFLFQDAFSGRAEFGLIGDDHFTLKVSPDGASWTNALVIDKSTGLLTGALRVAATDRLLGRSAAGAGAHEEIVCTAAGRALLDDADAAAQRATLGLGTGSLKNTGTSGNNLPLLDAANSWSATQTFNKGAGATSELIVGGANAQDGIIRFAGNAGQFRVMIFYSGAVSSANQRWFLGANTAAEAGANAGSDFICRARDDGGAFLFDALTITRASGQASFAGNVIPSADNSKTLGGASNRWSVVYAATGTINTSDAREKTALAPIPAGVKRAVRRVLREIGVFQWNEALARKGAAARLHVGPTAQAVRDAFLAEGEDPGRWALFCADPVHEPVEIAPARKAMDPETGLADELPPVMELRPVLEADGSPRLRLGVRHDQLALLALAVLAD